MRSSRATQLRCATATLAIGALGAIAALGPANAGVAATAAVDESFTKTTYFTEDFETATPTSPPVGWTYVDTNVDGMTAQWRGWSWHTPEEFIDRWGTDDRQKFTRAAGKIAVINSDGNRPASGVFSTTMISPKVAVTQNTSYELEFDSHYRQGSNGQTAQVIAEFEGAGTHSLLTYASDPAAANHGGSVLNGRERLKFTAPAGATGVKFRFEYLNSSNNWYWGIDNVAVVSPFSATSAQPLAVVDVVSDIQSDTGNTNLRDNTLPFLNRQSPAGSALVLNGDVVGNGDDAEYARYLEAYNAGGGHISNNPIYAVGNHEYFHGSDTSQAYTQRFLDFAGRDDVWTEQVINGVPLIIVGSEEYEYASHPGDGPFVKFSPDQLTWLKQRLDHWRARKQPVLLFSHHPLPNTVSGTYVPFYANDYGDQRSEFERLLLQNPNVILFTAHTHWDLNTRDWESTLRKASDSTASAPRGVPVFNTGSLYSTYGPSGDYGETVLSIDSAKGLRVKVFNDRVRVEAWDFISEELISQIDVPVPVK